MRKLVKTCSYDSNSVSLFDGDRKNELGETYCIASGILYKEADTYWNEYVISERS